MSIFRTLLTLGLLALSATGHPVTSPLGEADHQQHLKRQQATGLSDVQILQFALTLEHLEATFYADGFARFPDSDFLKFGVSESQLAGLKVIGETEAVHVTVLTDVLKSLNEEPVQRCEYDFGFTDASGMLAVARVLEAVGVSAYLGAAPLVRDRTVLAAAGSIVTVEARHQTLVRTVLGAKPVPQAFDTAVSARQVFTLAAAFITKCPATNADLGLEPFPPLAIAPSDRVRAGSKLKVHRQDGIPDGSFCTFTSGDLGTVFARFVDGACTVPDGLGGEVYVTIATEEGKTLDDSTILAGPAVLTLS